MPTETDQVTQGIAATICASEWEALPSEAAAHALRSFINFVGCAVGGSQHDALDRAILAMHHSGNEGTSPVIGKELRTSPQLSALFNCIGASVYAFDDTHAEAMVHPSSIVGSALIGLGGTLDKIEGKRFLHSFAWGIEIMCRLSKAISVPPAHSDIGWSQSGVTGSIGAAVACGKLLNLPPEEMAAAIGLAASQSFGLRVAHGTMAMHLVPSQASATGVQSALLARAGFTGPVNALEGRNGFFQLFSDFTNRSVLVDRLGEYFELLSNTFKAYPCGIVLHAVIDACLEIRGQVHFALADIAAVELLVPANTAALADRPHPKTEFEAQVSAQHWAAAVLLSGLAGIKQGMQRNIDDISVSDLRGRCTVKSVSSMPSDAAEVHVRLFDGQILTRQINHFKGSLENPMDDEDLDQKFVKQAEATIGIARGSELLRECRSLISQGDTMKLWDMKQVSNRKGL